MGIAVRTSGLLISFDLDESHESWPQVQRWIATRRAVDIVGTNFSKREIGDARWLELQPDWHHGYPQPKPGTFGYLEVTYNTSEYCSQCGIGPRQEAPFRMKAEPKWGRRGILQLNWIFDEYFVTPEVWTNVFKPHNVACRLVHNNRARELETVVQLVVERQIDIVTDGLPFEKCTTCGRIKYIPVARGPFPPLTCEPKAHMMKTRQYFGSGTSAHKRVILSQELARALATKKIRGASVRPVVEQSMATTQKIL
jgi:hypothetical protein